MIAFTFVDSITAAIVTPLTVFIIAVIATVVVLWLRRRHDFKCLNLSLMRTVDNEPDYDTVTEQRFNSLLLLLLFFLPFSVLFRNENEFKGVYASGLRLQLEEPYVRTRRRFVVRFFYNSFLSVT